MIVGIVIARTGLMSKSSSDRGGAGAFSPLEEEFFRVGDAISAAASSESRSDRDTAPAAAPTGLWSRLFKRTPRPVTEQPVHADPAPPRRAPTEPVASDDDWDWKISIARVRHSTNG